jgi:dTDP-4-amino-4,6-dideoxygalactose transaminase
MDIKFFKPGMPDWSIVGEDIQRTYSEGMLYPGAYTKQMESMMLSHFQTKHAIAVSSCSDALILLLCDLPARSKVIMPSYTFRATYQAAEWNNLEVVLTDVDENGYMDPGVLKDCLAAHKDAKCVMPVTLWGSLDYVDEIGSVCRKYGARLVYDAAHGMSTEYKGRPIGHYGDAVAFSIAVTKPLACGEGGIVTTNSDNLYRLVSMGRLHGNVLGNLDCVQKGLNAKISEINSILAVHGIGYMNEYRDAREAVAKKYMKGLKGLPLRFQKLNPNCVTSRKDFGMWVKNESTRDDLKSFLETSGIGVKTYFYPAVSRYTNFSGIKYKVDVSEKLASTCINLPCYDQLTDEEISYIVNKVREFYGKS